MLLRRIVPAVLAMITGFLSSANAQAPYRFQPGLRVSSEAPLSHAETQSLLKDLKFCTGLQDLSLDDDGHFSTIERTRVTGGSAGARRLLIRAIESTDSFILESANHSPLVAFAEIEPTDTYVDAQNRKHTVFRLRLDFADFNKLRGPEKVITAFGPAIVMLHELGHGVLKLNDDVSREDRLGGCERHVNSIRRELRLPERESYMPRGWRGVSPGETHESLQAEFSFSMIEESSRKQKKFYLAFAVDRVCDVVGIRSLPPGRAEIFLALR
jgi:hypothetical protein